MVTYFGSDKICLDGKTRLKLYNINVNSDIISQPEENLWNLIFKYVFKKAIKKSTVAYDAPQCFF